MKRKGPEHADRKDILDVKIYKTLFFRPVWEVNESRYQTELALAASVVTTVGVGVMSRIYSGGKIGVTQSNFGAN